MDNTFSIVRFFRDSDRRNVIATGLSLEEARAHCSDPETSSSTCIGVNGKARTRRNGPWFDGYTAE